MVVSQKLPFYIPFYDIVLFELNVLKHSLIIVVYAEATSDSRQGFKTADLKKVKEQLILAVTEKAKATDEDKIAELLEVEQSRMAERG